MNSSSSVASRLQPRHRQQLAVNVLSQQEPISHLANREQVSRNLTKKAQGATTQREKLEQKMESAKLKGKGNKLSAKLTRAIKHEQTLLKLANDIKILLYWLRTDILSLAGPEWAERLEKHGFHH